LDLGIFGSIQFDMDFIYSLISIVIIDLILAGDNAVIIAMAVRSLPAEKRKKGIMFGAGAAVLLRVVATFFVSQLLQIHYVKLVGGALILWIAVKLFVEGAPEEGSQREAATIAQAVKIIVVADITMSIDNMLAVGGASHGNMFLLIFGLGLSIPLVVFTSNLLSLLMDKYPIIIYIGAVVLGRVGGEMIMTDPFTVGILNPGTVFRYSMEAASAIGVIVVGKLWMRWVIQKENKGHIEELRPTPSGSHPEK
jgi:YjbE family integral membrane protein